MASKRSQIEMTPAEIEAYLNDSHVINIATIGPTGHPHLVAMWYGFVDGKLAFWTFRKSQKIVNLRRNNKITCLVESGDSYSELKGVELVGTGRVVEDPDMVLKIGMSVTSRYNFAGADLNDARPFVEAQVGKRFCVIVDVERTVSWDHSKLGGVY